MTISPSDPRPVPDEFEGALPLVREEQAGDDQGVVPGLSPEEQRNAALVEAVLRLVQLRSEYLVGVALAVAFPAEEDFQAFLASRDFIDAITAFSEVRQDLLLTLAASSRPHEEALEDAVAQHTRRAQESLEVLSELLHVAPEDLVSVLVR